MSQSTKLLNFLKANRTINPIQALDSLGIYRLAARVKDLRDDGYVIHTHIERKNGKPRTTYLLATKRRVS